MGSLSLLQGIFPTQGSNLGLPHCRQILDPLSYQGSPFGGEGGFSHLQNNSENVTIIQVFLRGAKAEDVRERPGLLPPARSVGR